MENHPIHTTTPNDVPYYLRNSTPSHKWSNRLFPTTKFFATDHGHEKIIPVLQQQDQTEITQGTARHIHVPQIWGGEGSRASSRCRSGRAILERIRDRLVWCTLQGSQARVEVINLGDQPKDLSDDLTTHLPWTDAFFLYRSSVHYILAIHVHVRMYVHYQHVGGVRNGSFAKLVRTIRCFAPRLFFFFLSSSTATSR